MALKLTEQAEQIRNESAKIAQKVQNEINEDRIAYEAQHLEVFKQRFRDVLPLIDEANITYSAHQNHEKYYHQGFHILFKMGNKFLKMDFSVQSGWRYEHVWEGNKNYKSQTMVYGQWPMDHFILWIDDELVQRPEAWFEGKNAFKSEDND